MGVRVLEYSPCLEVTVDGLVVISCTRLHTLNFHRVAQAVGVLDLVRGTNIAIVSLDPLTQLEELA
jgi:hypothetical protein